MTEIRDQSIPREERVLLAVKAYQQGQFDSTHKAATAYDIPHSTVSGRLRGARPRRDAQMNNRKLTATEETASYNGSCRWTSEDAADSGLHSPHGQLVAL
ncbi:helix-turn-helix, psq domain-containing protein [Hirsutella rhossiliensis]|uniref:Helix-turn-helix, psq domain-containing protein n=1 Tax=Hirsutella rhossiliensis TaxID=111463 RepID=A0A9P8MY09_9HYPO|nr:helix-turn-helix, psq domain-containing protein [Hirsutella rhossiliensis]KAH0961227.1 helix-turn-helix, psq domain-containing protein [Hirsutella rhossiliensis]